MLIGSLLRYRVTGWHQVAMGKQGTSANETDVKRGERKERGRKRADSLRHMLRKEKKEPLKESSRRRWEVRQTAIHRLSRRLKTRAAFWGLGSTVPH